MFNTRVAVHESSTPTTSTTVGSPLVSVPVLSNATTSTPRIDSNANRSRINTPARAARSVEIAPTKGIANPNAWGHAITKTVTTRPIAGPGWPMPTHTIAVSSAEPSANQNNQAAALSANRWARDEDSWAWATKRAIPANVVSSPVASTWTRIAESVLMVPATTDSDLAFNTVRDSPVTMDSSMPACPSTITPSAGTEPPGRTNTMSPTWRWSGSMVSTSSPTTRSAWSGNNAASDSNAEVVDARERISNQCPSSITTINRASSHHRS